VADKPVHLTPKEFDLLLALAQNHERVVSSEWLLLNVWGYDDSIRTRTLDVHINRLRSKIESDSSFPTFIKTICGVGYSLNPAA
jgi:DNA-binding response OmpR family regulator